MLPTHRVPQKHDCPITQHFEEQRVTPLIKYRSRRYGVLAFASPWASKWARTREMPWALTHHCRCSNHYAPVRLSTIGGSPLKPSVTPNLQ
eukprot:3736671-Pleurochrysis_carterae.AAC.1